MQRGIRLHAFLIFLLCLSVNCIAQQDTSKWKPEDGHFISVRNGKYKVWTKKIGSGKKKLLLLAGGPGTSFEYFEGFPLYLKDDYEIYYYSQLGSYLSDQPVDSSLQTVDAYVEEVEEVRKGLGLDHFFILGHSWASRLALAYAAKYQQHLKGLIMSNGSGLGKNWSHSDQYQQKLIAEIVRTIPEFSKYADSIANSQLTEKTNPELMTKIMKQARPVFIKRHFLRLDSVPGAVYRSRIHSVEGKMKWLVDDAQKQDGISLLSAIHISTLFIGGKYDYVPMNSYETARLFMNNCKDVTIYICPDGSHRSMWDDADNYFNAVKNFINKH